MIYDEVSYNGPHLSKMPFKQFSNEVKHHFDGPDQKTKISELYGLIKSKYPDKPKGSAGNAVADAEA